MGFGPQSHPVSLQSQGSGQGLPFGPDTNHQQSCRWPAEHLLLGPWCAGHSYMPQWGGVAFEGSLLHGSHCHCSDSVGCAQSIGCTSGPRHPQQGVCLNVCLPCPVVQLKIVIDKAGDPSMTCSIQLCHHKHVHQEIIICVYTEGQPINILMEFPNHRPLKGEKFQFTGGLVVLSLCQAPTAVGDDSISSIIMSLVEDSL